MPQLNPSPWFLISLLTWSFLIIVFLNKTLNSQFPNSTAQKEMNLKTTNSWNWPWY